MFCSFCTQDISEGWRSIRDIWLLLCAAGPWIPVSPHRLPHLWCHSQKLRCPASSSTALMTLFRLVPLMPRDLKEALAQCSRAASPSWECECPLPSVWACSSQLYLFFLSKAASLPSSHWNSQLIHDDSLGEGRPEYNVESRKVEVIFWGNLRSWLRSAIKFHSAPDVARDHALAVLDTFTFKPACLLQVSFCRTLSWWHLMLPCNWRECTFLMGSGSRKVGSSPQDHTRGAYSGDLEGCGQPP